jgi:uncharacterized membrane protein SpoIIM required for sporulation
MVELLLKTVLLFALMYYIWTIIMYAISVSQPESKIRSLTKHYPQITKPVDFGKILSDLYRFLKSLLKYIK